MAQKSNDKRIARREKSERNMNRAVVLLIAGLVAEWYLLMADRYYARGTVTQMLGWYDFFGVMRWIALALGALVLLGRSGSTAVKTCAVLALIAIAVLFVCGCVLKKNEGVLTLGGRKMRVFSTSADYRLALGVPALCFVLVIAALAVPTIAFYATWALAIVAFMLAVYYTIKLM